MHQHTDRFTQDGSSSASPSLPLWESITRESLIAEREGQIVLALAGYRRALSIARQLIDSPPPGRAEDCVAALVVSCHNLADLHAGQGEPDLAAEHLSRVHEALIALLLDASRDPALQQAAVRHSRETHMALIGHVSRHGADPLITRALRAGCLAMNVDNPTRH
ncbi:hypothetical protein ABH945_005990 [Paraburkholderia sp. GAS333]|uniref:DUF2753 family protein n=1 Tax=Paraburkholderia sp. GAS333 TaxID=3156279 RepID=UPI003D1A1D8C